MKTVARRGGGAKLWLSVCIALFAQTVVTAAPAAPAAATNPAYDKLFGAEEKRVAATPSTKDDAKFAATLLERAASLTDDPVLVEVLYEKAWEYGIKDADGFVAADGALKKLIASKAVSADQAKARRTELLKLKLKKGSPADKAEAANALLEELMNVGDKQAEARQYSDAMKTFREAQTLAASAQVGTSAEVKGKIDDLQIKLNALEKFNRLKAQYLAKPSDPLLTQMVDTALGELDDPPTAAQLATAGQDADLREGTALAAKNLGDLSEPELLKLAGWCKKSADRSVPTGKASLLQRSLAAMDKYLERHTKQDGERLVAAQQREDIVKTLASLPGGSRDKIVLWNVFNGKGKNDWGTTAVNLILISGGRQVWKKEGISMPWQPDTDSFLAVPIPKVQYDKVRIEVVSFRENGGGLAEVQVFQQGRNVALGRRAVASGSYPNMKEFAPESAVDGITTSSIFRQGYWLLPIKTPGWIEVDLSR